MTIPLQNYPRFVSQDFDLIQQELCRAITPHRLRLIDRDTPVDACINHVRIGSLELQAMKVGPAVEVLPVSLGSFYMIHMPVEGVTQFQIDKLEFEAAGATAAVMSPEVQIQSRWGQNCSAVLMTINRKLLHNHLSQLLGYRPKHEIIFHPILDLTSNNGAAWQRLWHYLISDLEASSDDEWLDIRIVDVSRLLMTTLLTAVSNNYSDEISRKLSSSGSLPLCVIKAEEFIKEHAAERPTVSQIAKAAGVSTRTLHKAFMRFRGTSPQQASLGIRLQSVRYEFQLCRMDKTVTQVATRWGFLELGRFAQQYRRMFGELPSQTLGHQTKINSRQQ